MKFFLDMLLELDDYYDYLNCEESQKFITYVLAKAPNKVVRVFNMLNETQQVYVINNVNLSDYYYELLIGCRDECASIILDKISTLEGYNYQELLWIFSKRIYIPNRLLNKNLIDLFGN